jgi:hypothetical protein
MSQKNREKKIGMTPHASFKYDKMPIELNLLTHTVRHQRTYYNKKSQLIFFFWDFKWQLRKCDRLRW